MDSTAPQWVHLAADGRRVTGQPVHRRREPASNLCHRAVAVSRGLRRRSGTLVTPIYGEGTLRILLFLLR